MKIIIVGSKGFIGSHCLEYFRENNFEVYGCDVVVDYEAENYFLLDPSNADFQQIFAGVKFDVCVNCSGAASVPDSFSSPLRDFYLNSVNVANLLEAIRANVPGCKFVNLSSAAVYGNPSSIPVREGANRDPISPYGFHKLQAELLCEEYARLFNVSTCSVRIFSAYGPGLRKQLFWDLYKKSGKLSKIELYGTGRESRDFIYVKDLVRAIHILIDKGSFIGESVNVASGKETFIDEAVKQFYSVLGFKGVYTFQGQERKGDPLRWCADTSKLTSLGYTPDYTLEKGLVAYAQWLKEKL